MTTKSEEKVIEKFKEKGYFHVHSGSPDFIFYKVKQLNTKQNETTQDKSIQHNSFQSNSIQDKPTQNPTLNDIDIESVEFVEVKYNGDTLNHEQQIWRHILQKLGLKYSLIHIPKESLGVS